MTKITDALVTEHVVFRTMFDHIERALPTLETAAEARLLAGLVEALLRRHSDTETNLAYVALDHMLDSQSQLDCLHEDHEEIDARLKRVALTSDCAQARRLLKAALRASRDHFLREERTVFPLIEKVLHDRMLQELGQVWRQGGLAKEEPATEGPGSPGHRDRPLFPEAPSRLGRAPRLGS